MPSSGDKVRRGDIPHLRQVSAGPQEDSLADRAVEAAHSHVEEGYGWVVARGIEKFFAPVTHDVLMARVMRKVSDHPMRIHILYVYAGVMIGGVKGWTGEDTLAGLPLERSGYGRTSGYGNYGPSVILRLGQLPAVCSVALWVGQYGLLRALLSLVQCYHELRRA